MVINRLFNLILSTSLLFVLLACSSDSASSLNEQAEESSSELVVEVPEEKSPEFEEEAPKETSSELTNEELVSTMEPADLIFDYYCNVSTTGNWEQCDEDRGTVRNLSAFDQELIYYRRFAIYDYKFQQSGNRYIFDLKNSTATFIGRDQVSYYERDFLFTSVRGNLSREEANRVERIFDQFFEIFFTFSYIEEHYGIKLQLSDFNPNWDDLESFETVLYVSPEEAAAEEQRQLTEAQQAELREAVRNIIISDIRYYRSGSEYLDGSFRITNNTGRTIRYMAMQVIYYDNNNRIIDSMFTNQGILFNSATVSKSLINRIQGFSFNDIANIDVVITSVRFDD